MATKLERLSSVLEAQHQAWSELENVLLIRRQALRTGDIEGVTKDSRREHVIAETLRQLDAERVELATALGASTIDDVLDQLPASEKDKLNKLREGIQLAAAQVAEAYAVLRDATTRISGIVRGAAQTVKETELGAQPWARSGRIPQTSFSLGLRVEA